ncbi:elongin-B-like [Oscarella lobularis]|uniref:elongin-B-like n=1 Tax=Oscarella lobularis TaxID=121494 RepID=UPI0033136401
MDIFLKVRRHKTTLFLDAKESTTVLELKKMVEGILKYSPEDQRLYREDQLLDDAKTLGDSGFPNNVAKAQSPAEIGLAVKQEDGEFEALLIEDLSKPPELPEVMKQQEKGGDE